MKSGTKQRQTTRLCAVISAGMMLVMGLPACTGASMPAPRSLEQEASTVQQASAAVPEPMMTPLVLGDETSKSLPVEQYEEPAEACSDALYIEEPMASGYVQVSSEAEKLCDRLHIECVQKCDKRKPRDFEKGSREHRAFCRRTCLAQHMACLKKIGTVTRVFDAFDSAWAWIKDHKVAIVGTIVIIGGVAYIVSTGGSGALVLVPLFG